SRSDAERRAPALVLRAGPADREADDADVARRLHRAARRVPALDPVLARGGGGGRLNADGESAPAGEVGKTGEVVVCVEQRGQVEAAIYGFGEEGQRRRRVAADGAQAGEVVRRNPRVGAGALGGGVVAGRAVGVAEEARGVPGLNEHLEVL